MGVRTLQATHRSALSAVQELCEKGNYKIFGLGEYHTGVGLDSNVVSTAYVAADQLLPYLVRNQFVSVVGSESFSHSENQNIDYFFKSPSRELRGQFGMDVRMDKYGGKKLFLNTLRDLIDSNPRTLRLHGIGASVSDFFGMAFGLSTEHELAQGINDRATELAVSSKMLLEVGGSLLFYTGAGHVRFDLTEICGLSKLSYVEELLSRTGVDQSQFLGINLLVPEVVLSADDTIEGDREMCERAPRDGVHLRQIAENLFNLVLASSGS